MTVDTAALAALIGAHRAEGGEAISRLGYFCAPFRAGPGPFAGQVVKVYGPVRDAAVLRRLEAAHGDYLACLAGAGVEVPQTVFTIVTLDGAPVPVVVQAALPAETMLRDLVVAAPRDDAVALVGEAAEMIAGFWARVAGSGARVGFHPSLRNLARVGGRMVFFDTFPPLIGYSRAEMGELLLTFSQSALVRGAGRVLPGVIRGIQDEWYSEAGTIVGLYGSACRLRPDDAEAFLAAGRVFAEGHLSGAVREEVVAELSKPPKLPGYWTGFRRALGLEGKPNI